MLPREEVWGETDEYYSYVVAQSLFTNESHGYDFFFICVFSILRCDLKGPGSIVVINTVRTRCFAGSCDTFG
jgi:hypothetical protein